jgi:hypothetical protein
MKTKMLPAYLLRRELLVPMCALLATGIKANATLATGVTGGTTGQWAAFAMGGGKDSLTMSGNAMIMGNAAAAGYKSDKDDDDDDDNGHSMGYGAFRAFNLSGNSMITGTISFDTRASGKVSGGASVVGGPNSNFSTNTALANQATAAKNQALYYSGLSNSGFSSLTKIKTSGNVTLYDAVGPAVNVLNLSELSLSGNAKLTLSGAAGSQFVINVDKKFSLDGNSQILLSGGVAADDVIFNFKGKKATMSGNSYLNGIIMAVDGEFQGSGGSVVSGQVIASSIKLSGNAKIINPVVSP